MSTVEEMRKQIHEDLEELRERVLTFAHDLDAEREIASEAGQRRVEMTINDVHEAVDQIREPGEASQTGALQAMAALGVLNAQLNYFDARAALQISVAPVAQAVSNAWNNLSSYLKAIVQRISNQLWQLISKLLKLKEWSVSGNAGVSLFGLAGTATLQLTFG